MIQRWTTHGFGWKMLKASGRFKTNSCLLRLFIIRHLLGRLTLIKLEWFQISVLVPATCFSCASFTCTNWKHIIQRCLSNIGPFWFIQNQDQSWQIHRLVSLKLLPNIHMFPVTSLAFRVDVHLPRGFTGMLRAQKVGASWKSPAAANPSPES